MGFQRKINSAVWGEMEEGVSKMFSFQSPTQTCKGSKGSEAAARFATHPPAVRS